ncbi:hypothetical protein PTSG_03330 [Salpingoeca rosetta]|uniref:Tc1-like transposase DDE domain-containing protein n=1 Tax=Salpingoeca rosetta (strain ATCC 50818 / BSB-021) TaxID=946362 RepID=F2U4V3_SALR5|nr:uncharacterized protein PTSG_03330 [Salpingoeca rosetta]EGD82669.1 hypothetical protein PTSG_03330 [Salpingoeca rosetta]|eukprot:XP_004995905.1 hypothetical protein PTSG_03330 [Salpingoeca rosetta]
MAQRRSATAAGSTDGTPPCVKKKEGRLYTGSLDNEEYDAFKKWLKKQRKENSRTLTVDAKLDIVAVQAYFRHEKFVNANKSGRPKQYRFTALAKNVLQRSTDVCQQAWKDYERAQAVSVADNDGPRGTKTTKFKRTEALRVKLQNWLYERTVKGNRTVAKDVLGFFCSSGVLPMYSDPTSKANALRAVQRYLESLGYERGQRGGCTTYMEKEEVLIKRDAYITQMIKARQQRRRIVYLDESYIHHHYRRHDESLYDPGDNRLLPKQKHKGRRFCFIAAIISSDPAVPEAERSEEHRAQLLPETLDIFEGGKKQSGKAQTKDYHGMFDSAYFERWMQTLLATLDARGIKNTIIVMDNAKYHKSLPADTPKQSWKKAAMVEACTARGLPVSDTDTRALLWARLRDHIAQTVKPVVVQMAEDAGHEVLWTPPHYSDLQPIEIVWANVKGDVGRQYNYDTTFKDVRQRLDEAFATLTPKTVEGCIAKANARLDELYRQITSLDEVDEEAIDDGVFDDGQRDDDDENMEEVDVVNEDKDKDSDEDSDEDDDEGEHEDED